MKKTFLCILGLSLVLAGCLSKEQEEKIQSFWKNNIVAPFEQLLGKRPAQTPPTTPGKIRLEENVNPSSSEEEATPEDPAQAEEELAGSTSPQNAQTSSQQTKPSTQQSATQKNAPRRNPIKAFLFIHSDSPACKQLKTDNWDKNFQQKYQGSVILVEYDMKNPASKQPLREMMNKYKMNSLTVPVLFIGNHILPGYPFNNVDDAVQQALAAPVPTTIAKKRAPKKRKQPEQFMEIIMEDTFKVQKPNTTASPRDSHAMQLALANVEKNNQEMLVDMGSLFGEDTKAQAYVIISRTERLLRNKAASSPDYKTYLSTQKALLQVQERELNQLMRKNSRKIRAIRG